MKPPLTPADLEQIGAEYSERCIRDARATATLAA